MSKASRQLTPQLWHRLEALAEKRIDHAQPVRGGYTLALRLTPISDAHRVRHIQLVQLKTALPWAIRALGLPKLANNSAK